jgi:hypothetical protein
MLARRWRRSIFLLVAVVPLLLFVSAASAQRKSKVGNSDQPADGPRDYLSKNFLLHTDLPEEQAKERLAKLEKMLGLISKYWAHPNKQIIEIYVVSDLDKWPQGALHPRAVQSIITGGGVTMSTVLSRGNAFVAKATSYAVAEHGTDLHEAVHAYCAQSFGTTGPVWYSEGMAEMGAYWEPKDPSVNCGVHLVRYIRGSKPKSLNEIINSPETTGDSWQNYAWRWALCHMLANNKNYRKRFRPLGLALLMKKDTSFERVYGTMAKEISFEYLFFLEHLERGLRVDLCSWDWKAKYNRPRNNASVVSKIAANRGWQPSRMRVEKGTDYQFSAAGTWKISKDKDGKPLNANGDQDGRGKLVGILFNDYELSEPFDVGIFGTFTAPGDGNLLLRCRDDWHQLADNSGRLTVRMKRADATSPLPKPKELTEAER